MLCIGEQHANAEKRLGQSASTTHPRRRRNRHGRGDRHVVRVGLSAERESSPGGAAGRDVGRTRSGHGCLPRASRGRTGRRGQDCRRTRAVQAGTAMAGGLGKTVEYGALAGEVGRGGHTDADHRRAVRLHHGAADGAEVGSAGTLRALGIADGDTQIQSGWRRGRAP